jgi:hypothetical protein
VNFWAKPMMFAGFWSHTEDLSRGRSSSSILTKAGFRACDALARMRISDLAQQRPACLIYPQLPIENISSAQYTSPSCGASPQQFLGYLRPALLSRRTNLPSFHMPAKPPAELPKPAASNDPHMAEDWLVVDALMGGTKTMRHGGKKYLPQRRNA